MDFEVSKWIICNNFYLYFLIIIFVSIIMIKIITNFFTQIASFFTDIMSYSIITNIKYDEERIVFSHFIDHNLIITGYKKVTGLNNNYF